MAYRSSATTNYGSSASSTPMNAPAGVQATDLQIMEVTGYVGGAELPVTAGAGWNSLYSHSVAGLVHEIFWAPGSVSPTLLSGGGGGYLTVRVTAYSGRNITTPFSAQASNAPTTTATVTFPSVTALAGNDLYVSIADTQADDTTTSASATPGGLTDIGYSLYAGSLMASYADSVSAGATPAFTRLTANSSNSRWVTTLAIAAAASGPSFPSASSKRFNSSRHSFGTRK